MEILSYQGWNMMESTDFLATALIFDSAFFGPKTSDEAPAAQGLFVA